MIQIAQPRPQAQAVLPGFGVGLRQINLPLVPAKRGLMHQALNRLRLGMSNGSDMANRAGDFAKRARGLYGLHDPSFRQDERRRQ